MDNNGYTTFKVDCSSLSPANQSAVFDLIEKCINDQRRLESAAQVITDNHVLHQTASVLGDLRSYRRVLAENMVEHFEPDVVQESIRIVTKAMLYISTSTDEICLIAGNKCTQQD